MLIEEPSWITSKTPVKDDSIPDSDMSYLRAWLESHSQPAADYLISLFQRHRIVILGEFHNVREHKEILSAFIPGLYRDAGVRLIGWEFSSQADNERLHRRVTGDDFDRVAALDFARDQVGHTWNSKEHWDLIEAVWRLNHSLRPDEEPMRLVGLGLPGGDMIRLNPELKSVIEAGARRTHRNSRSLSHGTTLPWPSRPNGSYPPARMHCCLWAGGTTSRTISPLRSGSSVGPSWARSFMTSTGIGSFKCGWRSGFFPTVARAVGSTFKEPIGFDLYASPFATVVGPGKWNMTEAPMGELARGYTCFGPPGGLHRNTPIKGFVTEETFLRHREFFQHDFGKAFESAQDFDVWLQKHRWPQP